MLRITASKSAGQAKKYYSEGFSKDDYYTEGREIRGFWGGQGAAMLGLSGRVDRDAFHAMCDNLHPLTKEPLTPRTTLNRTVGYDFTFDCPKSVSILQAISRDNRIVRAMEESALEALRFAEKTIETRVRKNGVSNDNRVTGNLVWGTFTHFTARPEGMLPDPHLHIHCYVFNCTYDPVEKRWKAAQFRATVEDAPLIQSIYHDVLAKMLQALGYKTERRGIAFEIVGIPDSANARFSQRTRKIKQVQAMLGITDPKAAAKLGAATRKAKNKEMSDRALLKGWLKMMPGSERAQILAVIRDARKNLRRGLHPQSTIKDEETAIEFAIQHTFERASAVRERRLLATVMQFGVGRVDLEHVQASLATRDDLIRKTVDGRLLITTAEVLAEEKAIVTWTRRGMASEPSFVSANFTTAEWLSAEQKAAILHIVTSRDRITGVQGVAGAGKTTLMKEAIRLMDEGGHNVLVLTPRAQTAHETLVNDGFKRTETVSHLLGNESLQKEFEKGVLWIDEAGQLSARDMYKLVVLAEKYHFRLILSGDTRQHGPVERGDALRILQKYADLKLAVVGKIQRQSGRYREAVEHISEGRVVEGFNILDSLNWICEVPDHERHLLLARDYLAALEAGKTALVISPTHSECRRVTEQIREERKRSGEIGEEHVISTLRQIDLSEAQRRDARTYNPGLVIQMLKSAPGFAPGERLEVKGISPHPLGALVISRADGSEAELPVHQFGGRFQVYEKEDISAGVGEPLRITKNGWSLDGRYRQHNGSLRTIKGFTSDGDILLDNGAVISRDFAHLSYGYATTSHAAQGKTVDCVFLAESPESFGAASMEQFNVSITRGREFCRIYTSDKQDLLDAVQNSSLRVAAMDLMKDEETQSLDYEAELRRAQERTEGLMKMRAPEKNLRERLGNEKGCCSSRKSINS